MDAKTLRIIDKCNERTRWAMGIMSMIALHDDVEDDVKYSADCASHQIEYVRKLLRDLAALYTAK